MSTLSFSAKNIKRERHIVDASGKVLGRLAVDVAKIIMGKNKPQYVPYLDLGDFVVVTNASKVKVTGKKLEQKKYKRFSGYPGGLREETLSQMLSRKPEKVVELAVKGMLPKNRLGAKMIRKLTVYPGELK